MLLVDMDVVNEIFWTSLLPWSVKKHLEEVFPDSSGNRKRRAVRMVNGINCTPYDIAHARGYLSWLVTPANRADIQTCLGDGINFLSSGQWGQGNFIFTFVVIM